MEPSVSRRDFARALLPVALALVLGGCMMGHRHTFVYVPELGPDVGRDRAVVVFAVQDLRKDVVAGDEEPEWVGEQRNKYGIPFDVKTAGKRPFADLVQEMVAADLEAIGFRTILIPETAVRDASERLRRHDAERGVSVVMRVFNSDTYLDIDVEWDLEAEVYGPGSEVLARGRLEGRRELKGSLLNPPKAAKRKVPPFVYDLIHQLIGADESIVEALSPASLSPARTGEP